MKGLRDGPAPLTLGSLGRLPFPGSMMHRLCSAVVALLVTACASASQMSISPAFRPEGWEAVAVLPFAGPEQLATLATQTFTVHLLASAPYQLIQPSSIAERVTTVTATQGQVTISQARNVALEVGAQAVVIGSVSARNTGATLDATVTVQLIDVATGQIVAAIQRDSGLIFATGDDRTVTSAAERAAKDMGRALALLSTR